MMGDPYEDRPASHAVHHATGHGPDCWCDGPPSGYLWVVLGVLAVFLVFLAVMIP